MKKVLLPLSVFFALFFLGCKKNKTPFEILTLTKWKFSSHDRNPSTTSGFLGDVQYHYMQECEADDTFKFDLNGNLTISRGKNKCDADEKETEIQVYSIDRANKKIVINGFDYVLLEESWNQIKYGVSSPASSGYNFVIFLLERA